jgi:guanylate kinase
MTGEGKLIIFSAPSGSGKTTIVRYLLEHIPNLAFSISATSRPPRGEEKDGVDYHFLSPEEFEKRVQNHEFLEWEEVYAGTRYGTLRSDVERLWAEGKHVIFDIDVVGGLNLKKQFGPNALAVYVQVPNDEALEKRLRGRGTDSEEKIQQRLAKAKDEQRFAPNFDLVLVNDDLERAKNEALERVTGFIN